MTTAVIFIKSADAIEATARCLEYCKLHGYHLVGIVVGDWAAVEAMLADGTADTMVADSRSDLPPGLEPRYEIVSESESHAAHPRTTHQRTRFIRRDAAE